VIRCRFKVKTEDGDSRPVSWPIKHPYWVTGYDSDDTSILVAYADNEKQIMGLWPEARDLDSEEVDGYVFTSRFRKPEWFDDSSTTQGVPPKTSTPL